MKKLLSVVLIAVLALALCAPAAAYLDVAEEAWYAAAVDYCQTRGLMDGMPGNVFIPDGGVTRAQLVTTLWRLAGKPAAARSSYFSDVKSGAWYDDAVRWAVAQGITDGVGDGRFAPERGVTREMMATFFYRYVGQPKPAGADFADQSAISDWAQSATRWAAGAGLMQGVGGNVFDPKTESSRAALAQTLMNLGRMNEAAATVSSVNLTLPKNCAPMNVARGADGALYVTDGYHKAVWRLTDAAPERAAGAESPEDFTGTPVGGYLDGRADHALFASPWGIAPFLNGWAISDPENNVVRVLRDGVVQTANLDGYDYPTGLAADGDGRLYIANTHAGEVLCVTPEGQVTKAATGLDEPTGLCYADGALYIAETGARRVLKLTGGAVTVVAGAGAAAEADFAAPMGLAVGADGSVYVADSAAGTVYRVRDGVVTTVAAQADPQNMQLFPAAPLGLLAEGGTLWVCDRFAGVLFAVPLA